MTAFYVTFTISIALNLWTAWLFIRSELKNHELKDKIYRLEAICMRRQNHINEISEILHELQEDEEHDHRSDSLAYTRAQDVHSTDEDQVRPSDQELHRTEPASLY